jgi:hypothetical protein
VRSRAEGISLVEALAALSLTGLLATVMIGTALAQMKLARAVATRAAAMDGARTAAWVLSGEARRMHPSDVRAFAADSIALRVFRGRAIPCLRTGNELLVRYAGDRLPDQRKDSLLMITATGERTASLRDVRAAAAGCTAASGEQLLRLVTDDTTDAAIALIFESGTYYLSGRALRYRLGGEGRQPLTAEILGSAPGFTSFDQDAIRFTVSPDGMRSRTMKAFFPDHAQ